MTHKLIQTENYLLVLDESEIKEGDWVFNDISKEVYQFIENNVVYEHKIIAHLPLNNSPILDGVPLLPPLEDKVEKLVKKHWEDDKEINNPSSFKAGYNKAKEKYKYTKDDLRNAFRSGAFTGAYYGHSSGDTVERDENAFIQSLQQPKMPIAFECEINNPMFALSLQPKTTTNLQVLTQWVGKYIY